MESTARTAEPSSTTAEEMRSPTGQHRTGQPDKTDGTGTATDTTDKSASIELDDLGQQATPRPGPSAAGMQYAEFDPHAAPQVFIAHDGGSDGSAAGRNAAGSKQAAARNTVLGRVLGWTRLRGRTATATTAGHHGGSDGEDGKGSHETSQDDGAQRGPVVVTTVPRRWCTWAWWAGCLPRAWRWGREKPYLAAAAASLFIGVLALIILPIVLRGLSLDGPSGPPRPAITTTTSSAASSTSSAITATSTSVAGTTPSRCRDNSTWATNVSFMGIAAAGGKSWPYQLLARANAVDCCTTCYADYKAGCQGWSYLPWDNTPVPCTILYGWNTTTDVSKACPNGRAPIVFTSDPDRVDSVGSTGPCGMTDAS